MHGYFVWESKEMRRSSWFPIILLISLPIIIGSMVLFPVEDGIHPILFINIGWIASVLIAQQVYHRRMWHKCKHCGHHRYMHNPEELTDFPSLIKIVCKRFERSYVPVETNYYDLGWRDDK